MNDFDYFAFDKSITLIKIFLEQDFIYLMSLLDRIKIDILLCFIKITLPFVVPVKVHI